MRFFENICKNCKKFYKGRGQNFCSYSCHMSYRNKINNPQKNPATRLKNSLSKIGKQLGDKNPNWRGGISPQWYQQFRKSACEICSITKLKNGIRKKVLNVHHKNHNRLDWELKNLITLCETCHQNIHKH